MKKQYMLALQMLGLYPEYQGKTKTIFVDSLPSGILLADIEADGFTVKVRE